MNQRYIFNLIKGMAGQNNILTIPTIFIDYTGDHISALLLSQLLYWSDKSKNDGWVFKTYKEFYKELRLSEYEIRKARRKLEDMKIIETKIKKANGNPTVHYRILPAFTDLFIQFIKDKQLKSQVKSLQLT